MSPKCLTSGIGSRREVQRIFFMQSVLRVSSKLAKVTFKPVHVVEDLNESRTNPCNGTRGVIWCSLSSDSGATCFA